MCEPATLAIVAAGVSAAGTAVTGYMGYQAKRQEAAVARRNATMKAAEANDAIARREEDAQALARKYAALRGSQRASMAANGIDVDFGSAADTLADTAMFYGEDAERLNRNTANELRGIDIQAYNYRSQSQAAKGAATGIALGTAFDVGSTILGGLRQSSQLRAARSGGAG